MKRKLLSILIAVMLIVCVVLCACNPQDGDSDGNGGNLENLDILALSLGRLENADLNFTFNVGNSISSVAQSASEEAVTSASLGKEYWHFTPDDMVTNQIDYNPFKDDQTMMDDMSEDARDVVDELVANITVMNTPIYKNGTFYYLSYESQNDVVYAVIYKDVVAEQNAPKDDTQNDGSLGVIIGGGGNGGNQSTDPTGTIIKIYYDENGNETVEYTTYSTYQNNRNVLHMVYTKDVRYTIFNSGHSDDGSMSVSYTQALKVNGKWCAMKMYGINPDHYVLDDTKPLGNEYDGIDIDIFQEAENTSFYYKNSLSRNENGLYFRDNGFELPGLYYVGNSGQADVQINLCLLDGWDAYHLNMAGEEATQENGEHYFGNQVGEGVDEGDYIAFANGITFTGADMSSGKYVIDGIDEPIISWRENIDDGKEYYISSSWDSTWAEDAEGLYLKKYDDLGGKLQGIFSLIYPEVEHVRTDITFNVLGSTPYQQFVSLSMMFEKYGLSWDSDRFGNDFMDFLCDVVQNQSVYKNNVLKNLLGVEFTTTNVKSFVLGLKEQVIAMENAFDTQIESYRDIPAMSWNSLPARPDNLGLINLADNVSGKATIGNVNIDFSQISADVDKNILLGQNRQYTILTYLASGNNIIVMDAFDTHAYANASFTLDGKSVALSSVDITKEGEYSLFACVAKVEGETYTRLSEVVQIDVNTFASFETRKDGVGGEYVYTYSCDNGKLKVDVKFIDEQAPTITLDLDAIVDTNDDGVYEIYFTNDMSVSIEDLIEKISVVDNHDGVITISNMHFFEQGSTMPLAENYEFEDGKIYNLVVKDNAGNTTTVSFAAMIVE